MPGRQPWVALPDTGGYYTYTTVCCDAIGMMIGMIDLHTYDQLGGDRIYVPQ